ncbi:hypothetical protein ACWF94_10805 [Streptomyces sp. NPDC055078]
MLVLVLDIAPDDSCHPLFVVTGLRCSLEEHEDGPHYDLVRELDGAAYGEIWARWADGGHRESIAILKDCPADNGRSGGGNDACTLFQWHPGGHSFEFADPEYDEVLTSPEYRQLTEEFAEQLGGTDTDPPGR